MALRQVDIKTMKFPLVEKKRPLRQLTLPFKPLVLKRELEMEGEDSDSVEEGRNSSKEKQKLIDW
jgi:hypothetical protein